MKTFGFTRKINPKRFFPEIQYESVDFSVEGCETPQEAQSLVENWIKDWINQKVAEMEKIKEKELNKEPFVGDEFAGERRVNSKK